MEVPLKTRPLALWLLATLACGDAAAPVPEAPAAPAPIAKTEPAPAAAPAPRPRVEGQSFYDLEVSLVDQHGDPVGLDLWRGHPTLVSMIYTTCQTACPVTISDIKRLEVEAGDPETLRVLLVSLDPERDTPEALTEAATKYSVDEARWRLARPADAGEAFRIASALGIEYHSMPNGHINHSAVFTLLDEDGHNDSRVAGLGADMAPLVTRLKELEAMPR